jgi:hypothetical protein
MFVNEHAAFFKRVWFPMRLRQGTGRLTDDGSRQYPEPKRAHGLLCFVSVVRSPGLPTCRRRICHSLQLRAVLPLLILSELRFTTVSDCFGAGLLMNLLAPFFYGSMFGHAMATTAWKPVHHVVASPVQCYIHLQYGG